MEILKVLTFLSIFLSSGYCFKSQNFEEELVTKPLPRIISRGETIRAAFGERVQLPCHVQQLGSYVLVWQKGNDVLTARNIMVSPDRRFKLQPDHTLELKNIKPSDGGDYTCKYQSLETQF